MDITDVLPSELFGVLLNHLKDNIINIVTLVYVNKNLYRIVSKYAKNMFINRTPNCKYAALTNRIEVLKWAIDVSFPLDSGACIVAAIKNNVSILSFLFKNCDNSLWHMDIINYAALCGHIDIVKWILDNIHLDLRGPCNEPYDIGILSLCGRVDLEQHEKLCNAVPSETYLICDYAAQSGNLQLLVLLKSHIEKLCNAILKGRKFSIIGNVTYNRAVVGGCIHILEWLKQENCIFDPRICYYAAMNGDIGIFEWLKKNGVPVTDNCYSASIMAAMKGNKNLLMWLHNENLWGPHTMCGAISSNNLELVKWLRTKGCPWDEYACECAAINTKNIDLLKWLIENGCPYNKSRCIERISSDDSEILHLIQKLK